MFDQSSIKITRYHINTDKTSASLKVALIADLHNKEFGTDNIDLVEKIKSEKPDIIAMSGDMVTEGVDDYSVIVTLTKQLVQVAPVFYTYGNHELYFDNNPEFEQALIDIGATLLNNEMVTYNCKNGEQIIIGGLKQYPFYEYDAPDFDNDEANFFKSFLEAQKNSFSLLICHYPEAYMWKLHSFDIDLMLAGHTHGGIVRLPFVGGLFSPNQGWFGEYDKGYFDGDTADMIVTSGLGNSNLVPRFNNPPEVCIITIN